MADEQDDELIIVETDELPSGDQNDEQRQDDAAGDDSDHQSDEDDEGGDDARLADEDDDDEDENPNRKKRLKRRQVQKQAKEKTLQELRLLRQQNEELARRLAAVEGTTLSHSTAQLDQRLAETQRELQEAEMIIARAVEAGNGEDVAVAMRIRDAAKAREAEIQDVKAQLENARNQPAAPDPRVTELGRQWMEANPWYDPKGGNDDSAITNAIDARLVAEGYNPANVEYWEELTRRVAARINPAPREGRRERREERDEEDTPPRRRAPPIGGGREHAPASTRREVYVTPERKQAMIDAGVWDDPVARNRMLKAYQAYDREQRR